MSKNDTILLNILEIGKSIPKSMYVTRNKFFFGGGRFKIYISPTKINSYKVLINYI